MLKYKWSLKQRLEHISKNPIKVAGGITPDKNIFIYESFGYLSKYIDESNKTILIIEKIEENK